MVLALQRAPALHYLPAHLPAQDAPDLAEAEEQLPRLQFVGSRYGHGFMLAERLGLYYEHLECLISISDGKSRQGHLPRTWYKRLAHLHDHPACVPMPAFVCMRARVRVGVWVGGGG